MKNKILKPEQSIVFIDPGVQDYQTFTEGVKTDAIVVLLDANQDGVQQIADTLNQYTNLGSVHIISHGKQAQVYLGNTTLNQNTLTNYQTVLQSWGHALSEAADILIYGCNVAKGAVGQNFIRQLSSLVQTDIAASIDITGAKALGGNWKLAFNCGKISDYQIFKRGTLKAYNGILATETIAFIEDELSGEPLASYTKGTTSYGDLTIKGTDSGLGVAFGSLTNLTGPAGLYDSFSQFGGGTSVGIGLNDGSTGTTVGTWFAFATASGGEFDLVSLKMTEGQGVFTTLEAIGFRDGAQVGTQSLSISTSTINQTVALSTAFDNVDEVRVRQKTPGIFDSGFPGQDQLLYENFIFQPATAPNITYRQC